VAEKVLRLSESFRGRADEACFWEAYVASKLAREGLYVTMNPFSLGEVADPEKATSWDLDVFVNPDIAYPVEVKSRNLSFTDKPHQFPFEDVNVCSQNFFLKNWPGYDCTGRDFMMVSTRTGGLLWLPAGSKVCMGKEVFDSDRGEAFRVVTAKRELLRQYAEFAQLVRSDEKA
jgi:hypothetical protein